MINTKLSFIALLFLADCFVCDDIFTTLCGRILFKQPQNSDEFLYKEVINGVYIKTNKVVDNFPLYVNERGSIYFQFNKSVNAFYFIKSFPRENVSLGLGAEADNTKMNDPKSWVKMADQKNNVFGGVVTNWFQYRIKRNVYLKQNLTITCSNSTDCLFRDLIFNYDIPFINDPLKDYFTPVDNLYSHNRQVYKHSKINVTTWYLYYFNSYWMMGPNITSMSVYWAVYDHALKPEFITNVWEMFEGKKWVKLTGVTFQCRGLNKSCSDDRCTKNGVCSLNQLNRSTCTCFFNYTGDDCSKKSMTCKSVVEVANTEAGSLKANNCLSNDDFYDVMCTKTVSGEYAWTSYNSCKILATTIATLTAVSKTFADFPPFTMFPDFPSTNDFDEYYFIPIPVIFFVVIFQITGVAIYCRVKQRSKELNKRLFPRILSLCWYINMWLLVCFRTAVAIFNLQKYGPVTFSYADTIVYVAAPFFYLFILIEAQFCSEKEYLDSTYNGDEIFHYLDLIYDKEPQIFVTIECYHFETRTRITYTGSRGNKQSRVETYQAKVTTFTETKQFCIKSWRDVSDRSQVPNTQTKVMRVKLTKKFTFADQQTYDDFSNFELSLIARNRIRDTHIESSTEININGFKERVMGVAGNRPFWMNKVCFQLTHLLALSWPYRWLMRFGTQRIEHLINKEISSSSYQSSNISLAEENFSPNQPLLGPSFNSAQIGFQPFPAEIQHDSQRNNLCQYPNVLENPGTMKFTPPQSYPYNQNY